jgi:hypothetical protein
VNCKNARGFDLLCVIIGKNPFTGELIPFTVENVIKGFMSLRVVAWKQFEKMKETALSAKFLIKLKQLLPV